DTEADEVQARAPVVQVEARGRVPARRLDDVEGGAVADGEAHARAPVPLALERLDRFGLPFKILSEPRKRELQITHNKATSGHAQQLARLRIFNTEGWIVENLGRHLSWFERNELDAEAAIARRFVLWALRRDAEPQPVKLHLGR